MRTNSPSKFLVSLVLVAAAAGCKKGDSGRDPMKMCKQVADKGFASGCAKSSTPITPEFETATQMVSFTLTRGAGGSGQIVLFADETSAHEAFDVLRNSIMGQVHADYPTKVVIFAIADGVNPTAVDPDTMKALYGTLE